jgi:cell division protein FtsA
VKNILRKNLAIVIEARLKEIAEWIRREIKEAGCGSKFSPTLILTGGGSQMRDIEKLFARELDIEDVRIMHPEYGFTEESLLEHISSPADTTVASLLIHGAEVGACSVGVGTVEKPVVEKKQSTGLSQYTRPETTTQKPETTPEQPKPEETKPQKPETPAQKPETPAQKPGDDEPELPQGPKKGIGNWLRRKFENMGNTFIGDSQEADF